MDACHVNSRIIEASKALVGILNAHHSVYPCCREFLSDVALWIESFEDIATESYVAQRTFYSIRHGSAFNCTRYNVYQPWREFISPFGALLLQDDKQCFYLSCTSEVRPVWMMNGWLSGMDDWLTPSL